MKNINWILFGMSMTLFSCTKNVVNEDSSNKANSLLEDNGCIERMIIPVTAHSIHYSDIATVNFLFNSNGIDNSNFRYYKYKQDSLQRAYPPYSKYDQKTIRVNQYTNGLRIFSDELVFNFVDNGFYFRGGNITQGTSLDTLPHLALQQIRKLFIENIEQFEHNSAKYKDSCFKAEFGYFNLNAGEGISSEALVKAWRVTLKNSVYPSEYPVALFQDSNGKLIYYDNGIRTFK